MNLNPTGTGPLFFSLTLTHTPTNEIYCIRLLSFHRTWQDMLADGGRSTFFLSTLNAPQPRLMGFFYFCIGFLLQQHKGKDKQKWTAWTTIQIQLKNAIADYPKTPHLIINKKQIKIIKVEQILFRNQIMINIILR